MNLHNNSKDELIIKLKVLQHRDNVLNELYELTVTNRKKAEERNQKLNRIHALISHINQAIVRTRDRDKLFKEACNIAVEHGKFYMAWIGLVDNETKLVTPVAFAGNEDGYLSTVKRVSTLDVPEGQGPTGTAIREKKHNVCNDYAEDSRMILWKDEALSRNYRSSMSLPLLQFGKAIGAFTLYSSVPNFFDTDEINLLNEVTNDVSYALESIELERLQQESEVLMARSEETYKMLFESINDAVFVSEISDELGSRKFIAVNDVACERLGYTREALLVLSPFEINSDNSKKRYIAIIDEIIANKKGLFEMEHVTKDGKIIPVEISTRITQFNNKTVFHSIARDITQRKQYEKELIEAKLKAEESDYFLKESQKAGNIGSYKTDFVTGYWKSSATLDTIFGIDNHYERSVKGWLNVVHPDEQNVLNEYLADEVIRKRKPFNKEYRIVRINDNITRWVHGFGETAFDDSGNLLAMVGTIQDITERKMIELDLRAAKEKAEENDRLKTAFLQNMSHEIRTPMNAIMGFASLLKGKYDDKERLDQYTNIINQRCKDLLDIINDLLDISKIESGSLKVVLEDCNLGEIFAELSAFFAEYRMRIQKQHIQFKCEAPPNIADFVIKTDNVKLKQIFINLINNAFKFTNEGSVEFGCKLVDDDKLIFYVSDTGIGIPTDKQRMVFDRFAQVDHGVNKVYGGTGLGLSIVKGLVELLGGEITLESEFHIGSTFSFSFPHQILKPMYQNMVTFSPNVENTALKTLLIVEDDFYNAEYLWEILSEYKLNLLRTEFGKEAIVICLSQPVDLVLMDIRLPDIDGYEATRQIREHKPQLSIIAQTAFAANDEKQKALEAGCNDYISKPTNKGLLLKMINKYITLQ